MNMTSVTTAGEILPGFYLSDLLNSNLSEVLCQQDENLMEIEWLWYSQIIYYLLIRLPIMQWIEKNGKMYDVTDQGWFHI